MLVLDVDTVVLDDLAKLWKIKDRPKRSLFYMAEEQSQWYINTDFGGLLGSDEYKYRWPHHGRGFNSGVILMDLDRVSLVA